MINMTSGIYCYRDLENEGKIVYIGKDSHIDKDRRYYQHLKPYNYNAQPFNRILQKNPDRYQYEVLKQFNEKEYNKNLLNALEIIYIRRYNPKFNFTVGGEGVTGFKHSEKSKKKMSEAHKGKKLSKEHLQIVRTNWLGKHHSEESKLKMRNKYVKIVKSGKDKGRQVYCIYMNGKTIKRSINRYKLLDWFTKQYSKEILILNTDMEE